MLHQVQPVPSEPRDHIQDRTQTAVFAKVSFSKGLMRSWLKKNNKKKNKSISSIFICSTLKEHLRSFTLIFILHCSREQYFCDICYYGKLCNLFFLSLVRKLGKTVCMFVCFYFLFFKEEGSRQKDD